MFQASTCSSSEGQIVLSQHLVSSLSVNGCTVCRMRADCRASVICCSKHDTSYIFNILKLSWSLVSIRTFHITVTDAEQSALIRHTVQLLTESDDTRCCDNTICPPEDGHVDARNMSGIVV